MLFVSFFVLLLCYTTIQAFRGIKSIPALRTFTRSINMIKITDVITICN